MVQLRNELRQGQRDVLKVVVHNGREVGVCHRHHRMANWTIALGLGEDMSTIQTGVRSSQLLSRAQYLFSPSASGVATIAEQAVR